MRARAGLLLMLLAVGPACAGPTRARPATATTARADAERALPASYLTAFEALQDALDAGDDRTARAILNRMYMRRPKGAALELAQRFERVIAGRECAAGLDLALECRAPAVTSGATSTGADGAWKLVLVARSVLTRDVRLRPGPATVSITRACVDVRGGEERGFESRALGQLEPIDVPGRGTREILLFEFRLPPLGAGLCLRSSFELDLRSGVFERGGRELPAQDVRVRRGEARVLAPALASAGPASVLELAALARAGRVSRARALEIALRIPAQDDGAALDALTPIAAEIAETDVVALVPALRWLGQTAEPGGDPGAWRDWLAARARERAPPRPRLVLPARESPPEGGALAGPPDVRQEPRLR